MNATHRRASIVARRRHRGIVLVIALIAMIAMAYSSIALMRSVDATIAVTGNLGFWHAATNASDAAIEEGVVALFGGALIADTASDDPSQGYFAARQAGESVRGVPLALQTLANYPARAPIIDAEDGNTVRYVIERMCVAAGPATPDNCNVVAVSESPLSVSGGAVTPPPRVPLFRQTIRVDGPAGAAAFVQAWLADVPNRRRLSWRAIAE
jgi:type IV pilus assembly protein PilX